MKYFVEEITVMKDGSAAVSIVEKATKQEARSGYHQAMASAIIKAVPLGASSLLR